MDDTDDWRPIDTAPPETAILLRAIKAGTEFIGKGDIAKPRDGKPLECHWHYTHLVPTHWKPINAK
jgi:hypothetical protein